MVDEPYFYIYEFMRYSLDLTSLLYMLRVWLRNCCKHYHLTVRHVLGMCDVRSVCVFDLVLKLILIEHHKAYNIDTCFKSDYFVIPIIAQYSINSK